MVAPATSTTDSVAWVTSNALRAKVERSVFPRPVPRSASAGSVRVANQAGAAPKMMPVISASREGKSKDHERRRGADREEVRAVEREGEQQLSCSHGDDQACNSPEHGEQHAFGESLHDDFARGGADGETYCGLGAAVDGAGEQQIRNVGARDQENHSADGEQNLQTASVFFFHHGDTRAGGNHTDVLLRQQAIDIGHECCGIAGVVHHPRAENAGEPRGHTVSGCAGF